MRLLLSQVYALSVKDLRRLARDRSGMITLFLMPTMFILVMSVALQGVFQTGTADQPLLLPVVNLDAGATAPDGTPLSLGQQVIDALASYPGFRLLTAEDGAPLSPDQAEALVSEQQALVALVLPADFSQAALQAATADAPPPQATLVVDPSAGDQLLAPVQAAVEAALQRTLRAAQMPYRLQAALSPLDPALVQTVLPALLTTWRTTTQAPAVTLHTTPPTGFHLAQLPDSVQQNVPGYTVFGVFFIIGVVAASILDERKRGTLRRLQAAPFSRTAFLLGKVTPYFLVNLAQVSLMFALGRLVFHMDLGRSPLGLVSVATASAATGLGLLVAALGRTDGQVGGLSTLLALVLAAVGGMMVPTYVMPSWLQRLAQLSPHYWALQGYQDLIVRGLGVAEVLPEVGVLLLFASAFYLVAIARFRLTA